LRNHESFPICDQVIYRQRLGAIVVQDSKGAIYRFFEG
jgi:hypothetical protein